MSIYTSLMKLWKGISAHRVISLIENTEVNQFVEDYFIFYLHEDPYGYRSDTDEDDDLEIVKLNTINTFGQILKCDHYVLASETGDLLHVKLDLNVLCLLLTTSLPDSDPGCSSRFLNHHNLIVPSLSTVFHLMYTIRYHPDCMKIRFSSNVTKA